MCCFKRNEKQQNIATVLWVTVSKSMFHYIIYLWTDWEVPDLMWSVTWFQGGWHVGQLCNTQVSPPSFGPFGPVKETGSGRGEEEHVPRGTGLPPWNHVTNHMRLRDLTRKNKITFPIKIFSGTKITLSKLQSTGSHSPTNANTVWMMHPNMCRYAPFPSFFLIIISPLSDAWKCDVNVGRRAPPHM